MAMVLGASSPKTTCKKEIIDNPMTKAMKCRVPPSTPRGVSRLDQGRYRRLSKGAEAQGGDGDP
jgi:hypothetical protein